MSLPTRIYELGREIADSELVKTRVASPENMKAFQDLLNQSWPVSEAETAQRELVRGMYYSNTTSFVQYCSHPRNRVRALILWTESKRIAKFYNLSGCVHISWDEDAKQYNVVPHVPRPRRTSTDVEVDVEHKQPYQTPTDRKKHVKGTKKTRDDRIAEKQAKHQARMEAQAQRKAIRLANEAAKASKLATTTAESKTNNTTSYASVVVNGRPSVENAPVENVAPPTTPTNVTTNVNNTDEKKQSWADATDD